jgi:hypothetical protein
VNARACLSVAIPLALFVLGAPAASAAGGKADGTITVNGKTAKLVHAYAWAEAGFFDKSKEDVHVVLSDVPLPPKALEDQFERIHMAEAGKLHAMEITINADGQPISTSFRDNGFKGPSPSGLSSEDVFTKKTFDGKRVEGSYKSAKPHEFFGNTYAFDVAFQADIARSAKAAAGTASPGTAPSTR